MNGNSETRAVEALDGLLAGNEGRRETAADVAAVVAPNYSLEGLNLKGNVTLERLVTAVRRFRDGARCPTVSVPRLNILLSGVPGGGKSEFVKYLAGEVGAPLHTLRASDLLSKWIGESEKAIAKAFRRAQEEDAILFIDEVDSFLRSREGSSHSWEVSMVNELLQQMECNGGVMVAATNYGESLDRAVLRRFTFKLELDYLTDAGKRTFFGRYFDSELTPEEGRRLDAIDNLTPGDFRTVCEELFYVSEHETNAERIGALERESAAKRRGRTAKVGFAV